MRRKRRRIRNGLANKENEGVLYEAGAIGDNHGPSKTMTRCFIAGKRATNKFRDQRSTLDRLLLAYCQTLNSRCASMF